MAGWVRLRGPLQVRPCKLGRRIHAAHAPATGPTPPSTNFRELSEWHGLLLVGVDLGRHVDPRHAWMNLRRNRIFRQLKEQHPRMAWTHQPPENCQRWGGVGLRGVSRMGPRHASGGLGRTPNPGLAVCAGSRTRASRGQAYRDVLAASPQFDTAPPSHGIPAVAVAVALASASAGAGRSPAEPSTPLLLLPGAARAWCRATARRSAST
ncbi:UNVERIFIED_ORG: hypothetical protein ABIC77_003672 [Stenotrophomonas geniculata]